MDIEKSVRSLHPLERRVLPLLQERMQLQELVSESGLQETDILRALKGLEQKNLVELEEREREMVVLGERGVFYREKKLPELRMMTALSQRAEGMLLQELQTFAEVTKEELGVGLGILKKAGVITIGEFVRRIDGQEYEYFLEELDKFIKEVAEKGSISLGENEKTYFDAVKGRGLLSTTKVKEVSITLLNEGFELQNALSTVDTDFVETITPKILVNSSWKGKEFRGYDVKIPAAQLNGGRRHFISEAINEIRKIWLEFGFKEMNGPLIESGFWNFDALFVPQDHPARDMQDTLFLDSKAGLPDKETVAKVKEVHENGWNTGSIGWGGKWSEENAKQRMLRTHTTSVSARTLYQLRNAKLPAKFFTVGRVFRNEVLDWSHLFEFNQVEGIVVGDVNFSNLLGYLKEFYRRLGFEKARFRPTFYPYTEMSVAIDVYHPVHKKWIGLGGAGMFRPEVVKPLIGRDVQVLAWGPGMDRIIMAHYGMNDIRAVYDNDIEFLRNRAGLMVR